jgi:hypothetical protein
MIWRFITSAANWSGLALATLVLVLKGMGLVGAWGSWLPWVGYLVGFGTVSLLFGLPRLRDDPLRALQFDEAMGDGKDAMLRALAGVRSVTQMNPDGRLTGEVQNRVVKLTQDMEHLIGQWERSRGKLSLEETFHARHLALEYLPDALKTYLSIPPGFAQSRKLDNGQTAQETFEHTLDDLSAKVAQLTDDLAAQDADAFLAHSRFLSKKFGANAALTTTTETTP